MARPPNILLLFTDMQRFDTIGALGNPVIRTPHLDRLAREGTAFTSAYTPSPVCVPARYALHYGRHPFRTGIAENQEMPPDGGDSLPACLAALGYHAEAVGKCHFSPDMHALRGFARRQSQEECVSRPEEDDYCRWLDQRGADCDEPHGTRGEMYYIPQVSLHPAEEHPTQWVGDRALEFIGRRQGRKDPWFLFASFIHPHPPLAPPKPWHKLYRAPDMPLPRIPPDAEALWCWVNRVQNRGKCRDQGLDGMLLRCIKAYYYACVSFVDCQVGRILARLDEAGETDNTLIVFTSDHGEYLGDYGCFGKRAMHDCSCRIPFLARWPARFAAGGRCAQAVSLVDLFPTFLAAAGGGRSARDLDGEDLAPLVRGESARRYVFSQSNHGPKAMYMVADESRKYVWSAGDRREWLFDRTLDPAETRSLAGLDSFAPAKAALKDALLESLRAAGPAAADAYMEEGGRLDWRPQPRWDDAWMLDPDAGLGRQDHDRNPGPPPGYGPLGVL